MLGGQTTRTHNRSNCDKFSTDFKNQKKKKKKTISSGSGTNEKISKYGNLSTPPLTLPPFKGCNFNRFSFEVVALMPTHTRALAVSL